MDALSYFSHCGLPSHFTGLANRKSVSPRKRKHVPCKTKKQPLRTKKQKTKTYFSPLKKNIDIQVCSTNERESNKTEPTLQTQTLSQTIIPPSVTKEKYNQSQTCDDNKLFDDPLKGLHKFTGKEQTTSTELSEILLEEFKKLSNLCYVGNETESLTSINESRPPTKEIQISEKIDSNTVNVILSSCIKYLERHKNALLKTTGCHGNSRDL